MISLKTDHVLGTDIYAITDEALSYGRDNIQVVKSLLEAGVKIIQYREKQKTPREKLEQCKVIRNLTSQAGAKFIVNDDIDIALIVRADGIHVGQADLPVNEIRKLVGNEMIIGLSAANSDEARQAAEEGADYIGAGPIFETDTKKDAQKPVGLDFVEFMAYQMELPFTVIGGINRYNIPEVKKRGAYCFAMISELVSAEDIPERIHEIREIIRNS